VNPANRHKARGMEILKILKRHGPLSIGVLKRMTEPPMNTRRLRRSLAILNRKKLIKKRFVSQNKVFYQLSQDIEDRKNAAAILGCGPDDLYQLLISRQDWIHNECCE
jgi:hypothetical protein